MVLEEGCRELARTAPFPRPNPNVSASFAEFLHQLREKTTFERAVFPDIVGQTGEFSPPVLVLNDLGPLFRGADIPLSDSIDKRTLEKAECFVNGAARTFN